MRITKTSKVLSLILTICITFGMIVTTNAEEITTELISETASDAEAVEVEAIDAKTEPEVEVINFDETYEFKFIQRFNLMSCYNYDDFKVNEPVKRAEYAKILCDWGSFDPVTGGNKFVDIHGNEYEKYINAVTLKKLMEGYDKYTFLPDQGITLMEAVKPILIFAGYETLANQQGGYPNGYMQIAGDLDMLEGLNLVASDILSRGDLAKLVYNSRNIEIYNSIDFVDVTGEVKTPTLMTEYMNIDCIRGLVKDNGITGLRSDEKSRIGYITIGNQQFKLREQSEVRTYVGRYVEAYYTSKEDADGEKTIEYIHLDKVYTNDEITFDINKFLDLSGRTIKFENEKEREQKIELTSSVNYIYNNKAVKSINRSMFDYDYGTVTYVPARKGAADTIIIEGIVSWFIIASDKEFNYISTTDDCKPIDGKRSLTLPAEEIGKTIFIEDYHGFAGDVYDISAYDVVDICKSGEYMFIRVVEPDIQEKVVKSKIKVDYKPAISFTDGDVYIVSPYYATTEAYNNISLGALCYVYRNIAGDIVRVENIANVDLKTAYLIRSYYDTVDEVGYIKILTTDKKYQTLTVDEKITFSDNKNVTTPSMKFVTAHSTNLDNYEGIINYSVNKAGLVKKIYLPVNIGVEREMGRLGCIYSGTPEGYWIKGQTAWHEHFVAASNVGTFVKYPGETQTEKKFQYNAINAFDSKNSVPTKAYNYDPHSLYAELLAQEYASSYNPEITTGYTTLFIEDMSEETIYADETYVKLQTFTIPGGVKSTHYAKSETLKKVMDTLKTTPEIYHETVEKGDIIIARTTATDKNVIEAVVLLWDANAENPIDKENGRRGSIPGNLGYYDSTKSAISNPYAWYRASSSINSNIDVGNRTLFGYAYYVDAKGGLVVSSQELSSKTYDPNYDKNKYFNKAFLAPTNAVIIVSYKDNQVEVRKGMLSDIRAYISDGSNCSKVLIRTDTGKPNYLVAFNGEMK